MALTPTHYDVLNLSEAALDGSPLELKTLRTAYRRALLRNHPDKSANAGTQMNLQSYSVDQISEAFSILSDPKARAEYDDKLQLLKLPVGKTRNTEKFHTGVETVDLDDLQVDNSLGTWYRSCRCGDDRGYVIQEKDLEEAEEHREIHVGCRGCSLWLRVLFLVSED